MVDAHNAEIVFSFKYIKSVHQTFFKNFNIKDNGCLSHPCLNGGTCKILSLTDGSYSCNCCNGFSGKNCQIRKYFKDILGKKVTKHFIWKISGVFEFVPNF
jgi:hypothetical protein